MKKIQLRCDDCESVLDYIENDIVSNMPYLFVICKKCGNSISVQFEHLNEEEVCGPDNLYT